MMTIPNSVPPWIPALFALALIAGIAASFVKHMLLHLWVARRRADDPDFRAPAAWLGIGRPTRRELEEFAQEDSPAGRRARTLLLIRSLLNFFALGMVGWMILSLLLR